MRARRVVITGLGVVAPNGIGKDAFWESLIQGKSGISRVTRFDVTDLPTQIAGQIHAFNVRLFCDHKDIEKIDLQAKFGVAASRMALDDSGYCPEEESTRNGCIIGTSNPSYSLMEEQFARLSRNFDYRDTTTDFLKYVDSFSTCSFISSVFNLNGISKTITTSCTSALHSIGLAYHEIMKGNQDFLLAGSTDSAISRFAYMSFCAAGIMSKRNDEPDKASRPFDASRDGGVLSEGAAVLAVESYENAVKRHAQIYAEIVGYAESALGINPKKMKKSLSTCMQSALASAYLSPKDIDYICAHGPSDPITDWIETAAIKDVFGEIAYRVPVSSIKSVTGNAQSAAGAMQVVSSCLAIKEGLIPPTWNYEHPDRNCDLDYVPNSPRRNDCRYILINSHGFNGTDSCLILKRISNGY